MLYDISKRQSYEINLPRLLSFIESSALPILFHPTIKHAVDKWKCVLLTIYDRKYSFCDNFCCEEYFQKEFRFDDTTVQFHFDVNHLRANMSEGHLTKLSLSKFLDRTIDFDNVGELFACHAPDEKKPIFLIPFSNGAQQGWVVDGNHRVNYAIQHSIPYLDVICYNSAAAVDSLLCEFEKALYRFVIAIQEFSVLCSNRDYDGIERLAREESIAHYNSL